MRRPLCSQLYNAYVETQDQLLLEKLENKRINKYLDEIVKEVEAKAPILKRQREEYERAQKAVASLSVKLEQAMKVGFPACAALWLVSTGRSLAVSVSRRPAQCLLPDVSRDDCGHPWPQCGAFPGCCLALEHVLCMYV